MFKKKPANKLWTVTVNPESDGNTALHTAYVWAPTSEGAVEVLREQDNTLNEIVLDVVETETEGVLGVAYWPGGVPAHDHTHE